MEMGVYIGVGALEKDLGEHLPDPLYPRSQNNGSVSFTTQGYQVLYWAELVSKCILKVGPELPSSCKVHSLGAM